MKNKNGFTLVEVLIVIVIVGILAALILPAIESVREKGRATVCRSNLKQISLALDLYCEDNSGRFPLYWNETESAFQPVTYGICWNTRLLPYTQSVEVFHCPSQLKDVGYRVDFFGLSEGAGWPDYGFNYNLTKISVSQLTCPTNTVGVQDIRGDPESVYFDRQSIPGVGGSRHTGGANYLFLDGHVKWLPPSTIVSGFNSTNNPGCSPDKFYSTCPF